MKEMGFISMLFGLIMGLAGIVLAAVAMEISNSQPPLPLARALVYSSMALYIGGAILATKS